MSELLIKMNELAREIADCKKCQLHLSRKCSVPGEGNIRTKILFIGEGPGVNENDTGRPFVGQAGNFLNELFDAAGVKRQDVFITNVVKCRPPSNRDPMPEELEACAEYLNHQIEWINPLVIVTLGRFSMGKFFPNQRISAIHGKGQWVNDRLIVPMFHPAAALHQPSLRSSILHDFSLLPQYLMDAANKDKVEEMPVQPAPTVKENEEPISQQPPADDTIQLSLF